MPYILPDPPIKTDPKTGKIIGARYVPEAETERNPNAVEGDPEKAKEILTAFGFPQGADAVDIAQAGGNPMSAIMSGNVKNQGSSSKVEPKDTSATSGDVGDDGMTDAERGAGAGAYSNDAQASAEKTTALGKNILYDYASVNYIVTFGCLTPDELNKPDSTYRISGPSPEHTILRSSGRRVEKRTKTLAERRFNLTPNYYIDDIEIETYIAPNPRSRQTNFWNFNFTITEPYSMGQLLQSMQVCAKHAGYDNYLKSPWLIMIEFVGWDDDGNSHYTGVKKLLPLSLIGVEFNVDTEGSKYTFNATAYNDVAFTDSVQSITKDFTITGRTVKEALQSGLNSLATHINTEQLRQRQNTESKAEVDEYMIVFPTASSSRALEFATVGTSGSEINKATSGDLAFKEFDDTAVEQAFETGSEGYEQDNSDFGARIIEQKRSFVQDRLGYSVKRGKLSENIKSVLANPALPANAVGQGKLAPLDGLAAGNIPFGLQEFAWDKESGLLKRGATVIDPQKRTITFKSGTKIQKIIEEIVLLSDYGQNILNSDRVDHLGRSPWFRIESSVYIVDDKKSENVYGRKPRIYMYRVVPYMVHRSKFQMPNDPPPGMDELMKQAARQFDYMYTGKNNDILKFDINFDMAFYEALQVDSGNTRSGGTQSGGIVNEDASVEPTGSGETVPADFASEAKRVNDDQSDAVGAFDDTTAIQVARAFNEAIINSNASMISIEMEILGDPYFIADSGVGNYNSDGTNYPNINSDNTINHQNGEVDIMLNFRTPIDIGDGEGYQFDGASMGLESFSGLYQVLTVTNRFSENVFTQTINGIRRKNFELSKFENEQERKALEIEKRREKALQTEGLTQEEIDFINADLNMDGKLSVSEAATAQISPEDAQRLAQGKAGKTVLATTEEQKKNQALGTSPPPGTGSIDAAQSTATSSNTETVTPPSTVPNRTGGSGTANIDRYYRYGNNNR